jgi:hypothetical protein
VNSRDVLDYALFPLGEAAKPDGRATVAVDFDGVINNYDGHASGPITTQPMPGAVASLIALDKQYRVVIFTARNDLTAVRSWLEDNGLGEFAVSVTNRKPPAIAYIDDRAIRFQGWPHAMATLGQPMVREAANASVGDPTQQDREEFYGVHGKDSGVSLKQDKDGFFVHTHRARSKSYDTPSKIPADTVAYIESTG